MNGEVQHSIGRAASVLEALATQATGPMRASDIARATELGPSTITRLLRTLEELGYVERLDSQEFVIGPTVLALATAGLNHNPVHREARAPAQDLAHRVGLSVNVGVREQQQVMYLCHFEGALSPKSHTMVGLRQPLHASALGKSLLLGLSDEERAAALGDEPFAVYTANTITEMAALARDLDASRERGYCIEEQELALGRRCIAAPIRDASARIVGGISISGRLSHMRERGTEAIAEELIEVADRISVGLGLIAAVPR